MNPPDMTVTRMMAKTTHLFLLLFSFSLLPSLHAQKSDGWIFKNEKSGVKVYYRKTSGIYELKLITSIKSSLSGMVALLTQVDRYPKWGYKVVEAKELARQSETDQIYYSKLDFPWPMEDRDIVMHNTLVQDPVTRRITSVSEAAPDYIPEKEEVVRIRTAKTVWNIVPGAGGWLYVEYYINSDPGGNIPDWLVNMALDVGPREVIGNIRSFVALPEYQSAKLTYIRE